MVDKLVQGNELHEFATTLNQFKRPPCGKFQLWKDMHVIVNGA